MRIEISTDGGCDPNPGPGGSGIFIELWDDKGKKLEEISIYRSILQTTNNRAELTAMQIALEWIIENKYKKVLMNIDSKYVLNPIEKGWLKTWIANEWVRDDGDPYKNSDLWQQVSPLLAKAKAMCDIKMKWVRGHSGHYGNEHADGLATIGKSLATAGIEEHKVQRKQQVSETGEPIKLEKFRKSPLLQGPRLYFNSREPTRKDKEGRCIYYTGSHGKSDGDVGKRTHEALHCVTLLKDADPVMDYIISEHQKVNVNQLGTVANIRLNDACTAKKYIELRNALLSSTPERQFLALRTKDGLSDLQGTLVSRDISPPILGFTCLDIFDSLAITLQAYLDKSDTITVTDLTDALYDVGTVGKGKNEREKRTLKKDITTSMKTIDIPISTHNGNKTVKLTLGQCFPSRNTLSAITKDSPSVKAITWTEGGKSFRLAFVLETTEGVSLWTSFYSALYFTD